MADGTYQGRGSPRDQLEIVITKVPKQPTLMRVRWLARLDGLHVHFRKQRIPCGGQQCDSGLHRLPKSWIGYAPAEVLNTRDRLWFPTVVEVTERLYWCLEGVTLRGTVWNLWRRPGRRDREECYGEQIDEVDPQKLRTDVDTVAAVRRLYANRQINWGQTPEMGRPQQLSPSVWEEAPTQPAPAASSDPSETPQERLATPADLAKAYRAAGMIENAEKIEAKIREGTK